VSRLDWVNLLYIVGFALFIVGLRMVRGPRTAVRGNLVAAVGMAIALVATLLDPRIGDWILIVVGVAIGTAVGIPAARNVQSFLELVVKDGELALDFDDEVVKGACVVRAGERVG